MSLTSKGESGRSAHDGTKERLKRGGDNTTGTTARKNEEAIGRLKRWGDNARIQGKVKSKSHLWSFIVIQLYSQHKFKHPQIKQKKSKGTGPKTLHPIVMNNAKILFEAQHACLSLSWENCHNKKYRKQEGKFCRRATI
jgi:hypothetical protein